jgi:peptidyl-Lys metalloendopeptidase
MKLLSAVTCTALLTGAIAAVVAAPPRMAGNPLRVSIAAAPAGRSTVEVTITNTSQQSVRVPRHALPTALVESKLFSVSRNGEAVQYYGPMIKRGLPEAADFTVLRPGETRRSVVDLATAYDMSRSGQYTVTLSSSLQHASLGNGTMLKAANGLPMAVRSAPLQLFVNGNDTTLSNRLVAMAKPGTGGSTVNGVSYVGCSSTQISTAGSAVVEARKYSENAKGYLASGTVGPRYTTWFGAYTSSRYGTASQHFVSIDAAMDQSGGQIKINCGCNQSYYAYVYPTRPYEIFVCRAFWSAPLTGTDSKAGTLIHEMSHFNAVAGTDDHAYGQAAAKSLATSNPTSALDNADNHEYFAENKPALN